MIIYQLGKRYFYTFKTSVILLLTHEISSDDVGGNQNL